MQNLLLMVVCFSVGAVLRKTGKLPDQAHQTLNTLIIYVALPALTLVHVHQLTLSKGIAAAVLMPWLLFIVGAVLFLLIGTALQFSRDTIGALTLVGGLGNTSFVGLPMVEALHGKSGIPLALLIDQGGTYLVLSTLGMLVLSLYTSEKKSVREIGRKIMSFPPFIALCVALMLMDVTYPPWLHAALSRLGDLVVPLALISVGYQIRLTGLGQNAPALACGLGYKLLLCPALVLLGFFVTGTPLSTPSNHVILVESAMGPQIGAAIVASQHNLNPQLVTLMLGIGIPLSLLTATLWSKSFYWLGG